MTWCVHDARRGVLMVRVALTGSPGVGKTTLARAAAGAGWRTIAVSEFAALHGAVVGYDEEDEAEVVDTDALGAFVPPDDGHRVLYDGHLSHQLGLDVTWVVRCHPDELARRLTQRMYKPAKIRENVEAEAMDLILQEALAAGAPVVQRDATHRSPPELLASFVAATDALAGAAHDVEPVDWSAWLMEAGHGP